MFFTYSILYTFAREIWELIEQFAIVPFLLVLRVMGPSFDRLSSLVDDHRWWKPMIDVIAVWSQLFHTHRYAQKTLKPRRPTWVWFRAWRTSTPPSWNTPTHNWRTHCPQKRVSSQSSHRHNIARTSSQRELYSSDDVCVASDDHSRHSFQLSQSSLL